MIQVNLTAGIVLLFYSLLIEKILFKTRSERLKFKGFDFFCVSDLFGVDV